jgi:hypothetical protein
MSALGQKLTFRSDQSMSAIPPKADIPRLHHDVSFGPEADIPFIRLLDLREPAALPAS